MAARAEAERATRSKSRFLSAANHDLRQPFQAIHLFLHLLQSKVSDPAQQSPVTRIQEAVQSGETLLTFEGSGADTFWELEFPAAANPYGLDLLADVLVTFDAHAGYSAELHAQHLAARPRSVRRIALGSAAPAPSRSTT